MIEVISHTWFTNTKGTIGVVIYNDGFKNKAKISIVEGKNPEVDIKTVIDFGSSFPLIAACLLLESKIERFKALEKIF